MKTTRSSFRISLLLALLWCGARAEPPPANATAASTTETTPAEVIPTPANELKPAVAPAEPAVAAPSPTTAPTPEPSPALRSLIPDTSAPAEAAPQVQEKSAAPAAPQPAAKPVAPHRPHHGREGDAVVAIFDNAEAWKPVDDAVVAVFGNSHAHEDVSDAVVAVFGNATADKEVGDAVVAVFGTAHVYGHVHGDVVAVLGTVELGPEAVVDGNAVSVGGRVQRSPGSEVHGNTSQMPFLGPLASLGSVADILHTTVFRGRLLSFSQGAAALWVIAFCFLAVYLAFAALFPRAVTRCAETLEQRPGRTIGVAVLAMLALPLLMLLMLVLLFTVVPPMLFFTAVLICSLFGKAAFLAWLGRRVYLRPGTAGVVLAVLMGGAIMLLLYTIPLLGLLIWKTSGTLGFGMAVYTAMLSVRREKPPAQPGAPAPHPVPPPPAMPGQPAAPIAPATATVATTLPPASMPSAPGLASTASSEPTPPALVPPPLGVVAAAPLPTLRAEPIAFSALPRAGFWIRTAAAALDWIALSVFVSALHMSGLLILFFTVYCVVLWANKGTTLGGVICGLKVVRLDDRPMDWSIAIVRALGAFLSAIVCFLGFIWVAIDPNAQAWHDKIAGTTVVRVPKGVTLI